MPYFNCGERKICSTIKNSQNITNMIVALLDNEELKSRKTISQTPPLVGHSQHVATKPL